MIEPIKLPSKICRFMDDVKAKGDTVADALNFAGDYINQGEAREWLFQNETYTEDYAHQAAFAQAWLVGYQENYVTVRVKDKHVVYMTSNDGVHVKLTSNPNMATRFADREAAKAVAQLMNGDVLEYD